MVRRTEGAAAASMLGLLLLWLLSALPEGTLSPARFVKAIVAAVPPAVSVFGVVEVGAFGDVEEEEEEDVAAVVEDNGLSISSTPLMVREVVRSCSSCCSSCCCCCGGVSSAASPPGDGCDSVLFSGSFRSSGAHSWLRLEDSTLPVGYWGCYCGSGGLVGGESRSAT